MEEDNVQQPQEYFTAEVQNKMSAMKDNEMLELLSQLEDSPFWIAILRYNQSRLSQSQSAIFIGDPVKDPTSISRHQGIMLGLSDMQNAVIMLVQQRDQARKEAEKAEQTEKAAKKK